MTPPPHAPLDIVTVLITLFSAILAPELANVLGPYVVIVLCALGGAAWSSTYGEASTRRSTALHIALMVGLALIATVPLAEMAARIGGFQSRWAFGPMAALIAARPDWVIAEVRDLWRSKRGPQGPGGQS